MPIDVPHDIKKSSIFPPQFLPILANYDPLALLTSSTTSTTNRPFVNLFEPHRPQSVHQSTFVAHNPSEALNEFHRPPIASFSKPITSVSSGGHHQHHDQHQQQHRPSRPWKPQKPSADTWDIYSLNITDELRQLLEAERIHLKNVSIHLKPKFPVTNSRWSHQDEDVFVARSNNPFGHSTKWKLR